MEIDDEVEKVPILRVTQEGRSNVEETVARESALTIILNNKELVTLLCSPGDLKSLAVGFLVSEGLLASKAEITKLLVDDSRGLVRLETIEDKGFTQEVLAKRVLTSGCGAGTTFFRAVDAAIPKVESKMTISPDEVFALVNQFQHGSELYLATHGVHSAALCDRKSIQAFSEDIGRHNAIDKIFGRYFLEGKSTDNHLVITSGRVSSEILNKVAKRGIPIVVSISAPTSLGVRISNQLGITLIGSVRGKKMNIYANDWRVS
ncbi:MAG: formate dehydrogenase accessory sulfurtransferase FdhD [Chloroflexi bacterium]|nr:formate dehydrogenase accessory sulfurtransferase FdhD [Chloroflexota bacterium]MBI2979971.1 formate dehydrogenase accessory sulfurtransferase FdhD [Chloroflexota bacterium]